MIRIFLMALVALSLGACASGPPRPQSEALQLATAAGLDLRDVTREQVEKALKDKPSAAPNVALTVGTAAGAFTPPPGISAGAATGLLALGTIVESLSVDPEAQVRLLLWMPVSEVDSVEQAPDRLVSIVETALGEALGDPSLRFEPTKWGPDNLAMYPSIPGCTGECRVGLGYFRDPDLGEAPSLLGGGPSYEWKTTRFKSRAGFGINAPGLSDTELLELYAAVSRALPEWAYIYLAPGYYGVKSLPAPIILSQGRSLLFVEPGALPESSDLASAPSP